MSKSKNEANRTANAVVINHKAAEFRNGTRNRAMRLYKAVKPITDVWYQRFGKAAEQGSDAVLEEWSNYHHEFFQTMEHPDDEIFRYAAIVMILNSVKTDSFLHLGIAETVTMLLGLLVDEEVSQAVFWYPLSRFADERDVLAVAKEIDSLGSLGV